MKNMVLKILITLSLCFVVYGQISIVKNVVITPKPNKESTAVIITWETPADLAGNGEGDIKYKVRHCEINRPDTCKDSELTAEKRYEVTGLKKSFIYSYHITAQGSDNKPGAEKKGIFKTEDRDTCQPNEYTCTQSPQCIDPKRKCDGLVNCQDGSDENGDAGCLIPANKPKAVEAKDPTENSFTLTYKQVPQPDRAISYDIEILIVTTNAKKMQEDTHIFTSLVKTVPITGLQSGTEYKVRVRAVNRVGPGLYSDYVSITTKSVPLKVRNVKATPIILKETTAFTLMWDTPADLAGNSEADLKYEVKYCEINRADTCKTIPMSAEKKAEISGLKPNFLYSYHITTYGKDNQKGSEYKAAYRTKTKVSCQPNQFTCAQSGQCIEPIKKCDGLVNCADGSDEGAPAGCTKPATAPSNQKIVNVKESSLKFTFKPVGLKERVTEYEIEILDTKTNITSKRTLIHGSLSLAEKSLEVTGLKTSTEYKLRVRAKNRVGFGPWTDYVKATTSAEKLIVQNVKATPKILEETTAFTLMWDTPADLAGNSEADLKYEVKYCEINRADTCKTIPMSAEKKAEISGLKPNFLYSYHITTYGKDNQKGSEYKTTYRTKTKVTCQSNQYTCLKVSKCIDPKMKCDGIVNCGDGSDENGDAGCTQPSEKPKQLSIEDIKGDGFTVKYRQVKSSDRATGYEIEILNTKTNAKSVQKDGHDNFGVPIRAVGVNGLSGNTEYKVRVRAINRVGPGQFSDYVTATTKESEKTTGEGNGLSKVTNVKISPKVLFETTATIIEWDAPDNLGENTESDLKYNVKYCEINKEDSCKETEISTSKRVELTGLKKDFIYNYLIIPYNKNNTRGQGYSETFRTGKKRTCSSKQFTCTNTDGCVENSRKCDGITNCADSSDEGENAECTVPNSVPTAISVEEVTTTSLKFKYTQVTARNRATSYEIEILDVRNKEKFSQVNPHEQYGINFKTIDIQGLKPVHKYKIRIRAVNRVGKGRWSNDVEVITQGVGKVSQVKVASSENTVRLVWQAPTMLNGENPSSFKYLIKYCRVEGSQKVDCKKVQTKDKFKIIRSLKAASTYEYEIIALTSKNEQSAVFIKTVSTEKEEFKTTGSDINDDSSSGMSTAQKAGIAVGIVLIIIILIVAIVACIRHRKSSGKSDARHTNGKHNSGYEMDQK